LLDTLAGATIARLATAKHFTASGEVVIDARTAEALAAVITLNAWRVTETGEHFAVVAHLMVEPSPYAPEEVWTLRPCGPGSCPPSLSANKAGMEPF
jgi:hypothetical protein